MFALSRLNKLLAALVLTCATAFVAPRVPVSPLVKHNVLADPEAAAPAPGSYAAARAAAQAAKSGAPAAAVPPAAPAPPAATPGERYVPDAKVMRAVLSTLGERIGPSGRPLSQGRQLDSFTKNVDEIITAFGGVPSAAVAPPPPPPHGAPGTSAGLPRAPLGGVELQ